MCLGLTGCEMSHWAVCQPLPRRSGQAWRLSVLIVPFGVLPSPSAGINLSQQGLTDSSPDACCLLSLLSFLFPPPLHTVFLSPNTVKPLPGHSHRSQPPWGLASRLIVMLLNRCLHKEPHWACFNVDCDASVSHRMFAIFVAQQVTRSHLLSCRLMECPCGESPFCRGASDLVLWGCFLARAGKRVECALCPLCVCVYVSLCLHMCEFADVCVMVHSTSCGSCGVCVPSLQAVWGCPALLWVWEELPWVGTRQSYSD